MGSYAYPQTLVDTDWVHDHREDPDVRVVEVDVDTFAFEEGHIPGAIGWDWASQLCDTRLRDILSKAGFEALMGASGITPQTTVVLYGDNNNWFAAWAFWQMKIYGHEDVRLMNGGRTKWLAEGRELTFEEADIAPTTYVAKDADMSLRDYQGALAKKVDAGSLHLVDVRSVAEFTGELLAPPGLPETCQRGGHIPGAANVPWGEVCAPDGTFKSRDELAALYAARGVTGDKPITAYCRIGERSSHTWFALKYLLGYEDVRNYDGSWTEWGNLVAAPIERP
ncbi:MAG: sulfurtransferase [Sandaracinaceae bacterium]|nr:sulfurtransferase [Sandaracinaceae bacterium]